MKNSQRKTGSPLLSSVESSWRTQNMKSKSSDNNVLKLQAFLQGHKRKIPAALGLDPAITPGGKPKS